MSPRSEADVKLRASGYTAAVKNEFLRGFVQIFIRGAVQADHRFLQPGQLTVWCKIFRSFRNSDAVMISASRSKAVLCRCTLFPPSVCLAGQQDPLRLSAIRMHRQVNCLKHTQDAGQQEDNQQHHDTLIKHRKEKNPKLLNDS